MMNTDQVSQHRRRKGLFQLTVPSLREGRVRKSSRQGQRPENRDLSQYSWEMWADVYSPKIQNQWQARVWIPPESTLVNQWVLMGIHSGVRYAVCYVYAISWQASLVDHTAHISSNSYSWEAHQDAVPYSPWCEAYILFLFYSVLSQT